MILTAGLLALGTGSASAEPDWLPLAPILDPPPVESSAQRIGFDSAGRETVASLRVVSITPVNTEMTIGTRLPGDALSTEFTVGSSPGRHPVGSTLAVAPSGAAVACIIDLLGDDPSANVLGFRATYRAAGANTWSAPVVVADSLVKSGFFLECIPVIAKNGTAAVVAPRVTAEPAPAGEPRRAQIVARVKPAAGDWTAAEILSGADRNAQVPLAAMDDAGNLMVAWNERWAGNDTDTTADDFNTVKLRTRSASSGFFGLTGDPALAEGAPSKNTFAPALAENGSGRAIIAWQQAGQAWATTRADAAASFEAPQQMVTGGASSSPGAVGVAPDGTAYLAYWNQSSPTRAGMMRRPPGELWSGMKPTGPSGVFGGYGEMAFVGNDLVFASTSATGGTPVKYAVRWRRSLPDPDEFREILPSTNVDQLENLESDKQGGLFATYDHFDVDGTWTNTVAFDGSPPVSKSLDVPASAAPGASVNMSATFGDRWSAMGAVTWNFGDGTTGAGESVAHAWAAPGSYEVTVNAVDALGNLRQVKSTVSVAAEKVKPKVAISLPACGKRKGKACKNFRKTRKAWRALKGRASDSGGSGLARVEVGVSRKAGKKFDVLVGKKIKTGQTAKKASKTFVRAKLNKGKWSLAIPKSWKPGTWTFRVRATDGAGNVSQVVLRKVKLR